MGGRPAICMIILVTDEFAPSGTVSIFITISPICGLDIVDSNQ